MKIKIKLLKINNPKKFIILDKEVSTQTLFKSKELINKTNEIHKEFGFCLCSNNKIEYSKEIEGGIASIKLEEIIRCECPDATKKVGIFHTHEGIEGINFEDLMGCLACYIKGELEKPVICVGHRNEKGKTQIDCYTGIPKRIATWYLPTPKVKYTIRELFKEEIYIYD